MECPVCGSWNTYVLLDDADWDEDPENDIEETWYACNDCGEEWQEY